MEPDRKKKADAANADDDAANDDNAGEIWLPLCGESQAVPFLAFLFLSCASCQSESGLAANVYSAFTIIG